MQFFILFVIGAVIIGAGSMLAPAWHTSQPRIGLASILALALVSGGAVFWAYLFGWDTLLIDYLLFALVSVVILGGTMAQAQVRAEASGGELLDADVGWPGPQDLAFFGVIALLCAVPLVIFPLPQGIHAIHDALTTLSARDGGTFQSLSPYAPEITLSTAPGFYGLSAYLSQQLRLPIPQVHLAMGSVLAFLCVWVAYDLGSELRNKRLGRAMALAMAFSGGIPALLLDSRYALLMGVLFALAMIVYAVRTFRHAGWLDAVATGLMFGAVLFASPALWFVLVLGWGVALGVAYSTKQTFKRSWGFAPLAFLAGVAPFAWNLIQTRSMPFGMDGQALPVALFTIIAPIGIGIWLFSFWRYGSAKLQQRLAKNIYYIALAGVVMIVSMTGLIWNNWQGRVADQAQLDTFNWMIANLPDEARILNHPQFLWTLPTTGRYSAYIADPFIPSKLCLLEADCETIDWNDIDALTALATSRGFDYLLLPNVLDAETHPNLNLLYQGEGIVLYRLVD